MGSQQEMKLIADSGSTKVDWALLSDKLLRLNTVGLNPNYMESSEIVKILEQEVKPFCPVVESIHFFGAGIVGEEMKRKLACCMKAVWKDAELELSSDVLASALALFGKDRGIACILGTGSNSCLCEQGKILQNVKAGGFILGDEGSGNWIGKHLLMDYIKGIMPEDLAGEFEAEYGLSYAGIVERVYRQSAAAAYLASLNMFAAKKMEEAYIQELVREGFREFLYRNVCRYEGWESMEIGFVGSVAKQYESLLRECCEEKSLKVRKIIKAPIEELIKYYESN